MELIALVAQSLLGAAYIYHLATEHAKDMAAVKSQVATLRSRNMDYKVALENKNDYIKELESAVLDSASADDLSGLLTRVFSEDPDGIPVPDVPAKRPAYSTNAQLLFGRGELPETD